MEEKNIFLEKSKNVANINNYDNKISVIKQANNNDKKRKVRDSGIDLIRILAMYAIIIHHILVFPNIIDKYSKYKELVLMKTSCFWHVSGFALISGYIGYKSNKYSNLLYLWICAIFYSVGISYIFQKNKSITSKKLEYEDFLPVYFDKYWYFTKYFGMYLFLPVINKGIVGLSKSELRFVVITLILAYVALKDIINPNTDIFLMSNGYSVIWFLIYYLTGAYFGKFKKEYNKIERIVLSVICILVFYFSTFFCFYFSDYSPKNSDGIFKMKIMEYLKLLFVLRINSFPMILQSISLTLLLTYIKYNKYLVKIIIFIGPLTFGVYLIHMHKIIIRIIIEKLYLTEPYNLSLWAVI
jgi:surface polysaccharide O-acyltransferase-like enzyme